MITKHFDIIIFINWWLSEAGLASDSSPLLFASKINQNLVKS